MERDHIVVGIQRDHIAVGVQREIESARARERETEREKRERETCRVSATLECVVSVFIPTLSLQAHTNCCNWFALRVSYRTGQP